MAANGPMHLTLTHVLKKKKKKLPSTVNVFPSRKTHGKRTIKETVDKRH